MAETSIEYDLVICGGAMTGASLACALKNCHLNIAIIEANPADFEHHPGFDARAIALSHGSLTLLDQLNLGSTFRQHVTPITDIHVSDRGHCGITRLSHREYGVSELGAVIELQAAGKLLHQTLQTANNITWYSPDQLEALQQHHNQLTLTLSSGAQLRTRLLVGADGSHSTVRQRLNIQANTVAFKQSAIIANLRSTMAHQHRAFERFTDTGPIALLPLSDNRWSLVWSIDEQEVDHYSQLNEQQFLQQLQQRFGYRAGRFIQAGKRTIYPLQLTQAKQFISHRCILIGNAAHQLHPIAGQGFNLGLRDATTLASQLLSATTQDIGRFSLLKQYQQQRQQDKNITIALTSALATLFCSQQPPIIAARNIGLTSLAHCSMLKQKLAMHTMGKG